MAKRGRPKRNVYQVLRVQKFYRLLRDRYFKKSDYEIAKMLENAFGSINLKKSIETCKTIIRNLRLGKLVQLSPELLEALAKAVFSDKDTAHDEDINLYEDFLMYLRGASENGTIKYGARKYYQYLLTSKISYSDEMFIELSSDTDIAIDIAEILELPTASIPEIKDILTHTSDSRFKGKNFPGFGFPPEKVYKVSRYQNAINKLYDLFRKYRTFGLEEKASFYGAITLVVFCMLCSDGLIGQSFSAMLPY